VGPLGPSSCRGGQPAPLLPALSHSSGHGGSEVGHTQGAHGALSRLRCAGVGRAALRGARLGWCTPCKVRSLRRRVGALGSSGTAPRAAAHAATVARRDMWLVELLVGDSHTHGPKRLTCNINPERRPAASLPQSPRPPPLAYGPRVPGESARASRRLAELPAPSRSDDSLSPRSGRIAFDCI